MSNLTVADIIIAVSQHSQVAVTEQAAFIKVACQKKAIYLKKTKSGIVNRVDVSAFNIPANDAWAPPKKKNGLVTAVINCRHEDAIDAIDLALTALTDGKPGKKWFDQEDAKRTTAAVIRLG